MTKKNLVVLSGAGMSAESGLKTFRDNDGLWENHNVYDVATPAAWKKNPALVLKFYNERRSQLKEAKPNLGHLILSEFEDLLNVQIITQNVDDLHERAGSKNILHLHGELTKVRCSKTHKDVQDIGYENLELGAQSAHGHQLRPHIVWFGEDVPLIESAAKLVSKANIVLIIGTSMQVYPAAGLINFAPEACAIFSINPDKEIVTHKNATQICKGASEGLTEFKEVILPSLLVS